MSPPVRTARTKAKAGALSRPGVFRVLKDEVRTCSPGPGRPTRVPHGVSASRCYDAAVPKVRTTVTLDEGVLRWVKVRAARQGKGDSQVIEESLRRDLGLELMERLWEKSRMSEDAAMRLAVEAQHRTRPRRRK